MKQLNNMPIIESLIRHSGFVVTGAPSAEYPAAITVSYRNNPDGSVRWLWPKGGNRLDFLRKAKWVHGIDKICFVLGLEDLIADGQLKLYADIPTASYMRSKWFGTE